MAAGDILQTDFVEMTSPAIATALATFAGSYATTDLILVVPQGDTVKFVKVKTA